MERERNRNMKPDELGAFVAALVRNLRADAAAEEEHGPPERSRLRSDSARRRRDEEALIRDSAARRALVVEKTLAHIIPPKIFDLITGKTDKAVLKTESAELALDWWDAGAERVCVLYGGMGAGKSVGVGICAKHAVENGKRSISWHRPNEFVSAILHAYDDDAPEVGNDLVILDDMGRETKADFSEALTSFLDNRRTRLLITTNEEPRFWHSRYDPRLIQRIQDEGVAYAIKGTSMRQKGMGF